MWSINLSGKSSHFRMNRQLFVFTTGASGAGKTSILKAIESKVSSEPASVNYFDDIGVPSQYEMVMTHGSEANWQDAALSFWIEKLSKTNGKELVFLEGSFDPDLLMKYTAQFHLKNFIVVCVDSTRAIREARLRRYRPATQTHLICQNMENFAKLIKASTIKNQGSVFKNNYTKMPVDRIAAKLLSEIKRSVGHGTLHSI